MAMTDRTDQQIDEAAAIKVYRNAVRLAKSIEADRIIAKGEPNLVRRIRDDESFVLDNSEILANPDMFNPGSCEMRKTIRGNLED